MQENCGVVGDPMNRVLAWLVFGGYLSVALTQLGWRASGLIAALLLLPLACVLYPETLAYYGRGPRTDLANMGTPRDRSLPATLVVGVGWFVLLLPAILTGWVWLML